MNTITLDPSWHPVTLQTLMALTRFSKWSVEYLVPVESIESQSHAKRQVVIPFLLGNRNFGIFMKKVDTYTKS